MRTRESLILIFALSISAYHLYRSRYKGLCDPLDLAGFAAILLSVSAVLSSGDLAFKALTDVELRMFLGADIIVLILGSLSVIWIGISEIRKLFIEPRKTTK